MPKTRQNHGPLDQRSISPTSGQTDDIALNETDSLKCINNAPLFAMLKTNDMRPNVYYVTQGCCNSWSCPKCGKQRAKQEYWRIVNGCNELAEKHQLYFLTITCRGRELSEKDATADYLIWTNRLLDALRLNAKRRGLIWCYAQVTERQKRGHPHSHILTTYHPNDLAMGTAIKYVSQNGRQYKKTVDCLRSEYFQERCISAGLGSQYDISEVASSDAAARYVAKYLFKAEMFTNSFPKQWRRVRYSRNFPKNETMKGDAIVLLTGGDWMTLSRAADLVVSRDEGIATYARDCLKGTGVSVELS